MFLSYIGCISNCAIWNIIYNYKPAQPPIFHLIQIKITIVVCMVCKTRTCMFTALSTRQLLSCSIKMLCQTLQADSRQQQQHHHVVLLTRALWSLCNTGSHVKSFEVLATLTFTQEINYRTKVKYIGWDDNCQGKCMSVHVNACARERTSEWKRGKERDKEKERDRVSKRVRGIES